MKRLLIVLYSLFSCFFSLAQEYKSYVVVDDTISESGDNIVHLNGDLYTMSLTRCQPDAQSCAQLRKFDRNLNEQWTLYFPNTRKSNEHSINIFNDSTLIIAGRNNSQNQQQAFYHHVVSTDGHVLDFVEHALPYESNIMYGSYIQNNVLFMYGATEEDVSNPEINVDALITTYNLETGEQINDYFDYGVNFAVDLYDLQNNSDSTLVFISRRRNFSYGSERDYVIEEIQPDRSRREIYNVMVPDETGIKGSPSLTMLSDGRMAFFKTDESSSGFSKTFRILEQDGSFSHDVLIWEEFFPDYIDCYNLTATQDGGFIIVGQYFDRPVIDGVSWKNGMLLKITEEGELGWIRQYRNQHNITEDAIRSFLFDVKELPNGDIVATGVVHNTTSDLWVIKTNSEGCLGDDDCGETTVGIEEEIFLKSYINVYPNPVMAGQDLQVEVSSQVSRSVDYQLIDMQGRMVQRGQMVSGKNMVSTSGFASGSYVLNIDLGVRGMESKVVIVK